MNANIYEELIKDPQPTPPASDAEKQRELVKRELEEQQRKLEVWKSLELTKQTRKYAEEEAQRVLGTLESQVDSSIMTDSQFRLKVKEYFMLKRFAQWL
jgi:hypothetical protein